VDLTLTILTIVVFEIQKGQKGKISKSKSKNIDAFSQTLLK
jgi:hypothetical protein